MSNLSCRVCLLLVVVAVVAVALSAAQDAVQDAQPISPPPKEASLSLNLDFSKGFRLGGPAKFAAKPQKSTKSQPQQIDDDEQRPVHDEQPMMTGDNFLTNKMPLSAGYVPASPLGALQGAIGDMVGPVLNTGFIVTGLIALVQVNQSRKFFGIFNSFSNFSLIIIG